MSHRRISGLLLILGLWCSAASAQEPAPYPVPTTPYVSQPIGGDGSYVLAPRAGIPTHWSADDEDWYDTNRNIALVAKILGVVGVGLIIGAAAVQSDALMGSGFGTKFAGELGWSIADLRCANRMTRRGVEVRNAAGIAAVIGALLFSPITWISGPIQSMRIRDAHDSLMLSSAPTPKMSALGTSLRLTF